MSGISLNNVFIYDFDIAKLTNTLIVDLIQVGTVVNF